jgi:beta-fructofuranosidase
LWDFWLARDAETHHLFFLQAPRSIRDPALRHVNATIGHAISTDLTSWTVVEDALASGPAGSWDEVATWTGSVVPHDGRWYMFYTGAQRRGSTNVQRVGAAISDDLMHWSKVPGPLFSADSRWYETLADGDWFEEAWRDPWVFEGDDGRWHALVTARVPEGAVDGRGVIGHAMSDDLRTWEVAPPLSRPGEFGHLEVPQVAEVAGGWRLVFSCDARRVSRSRRLRLGDPAGDTTYLAAAEGPLGPFDLTTARPALPPDLYSGRITHRADGTAVWLAFRHLDGAGRFVGELTDPIELTL